MEILDDYNFLNIEVMNTKQKIGYSPSIEAKKFIFKIKPKNAHGESLIFTSFLINFFFNNVPERLPILSLYQI